VVSPFINSAPRAVEPFPILLNKAVQANVAEFLAQPDGLKLAFDRSRPFLPEMMTVMRQEGVPDDMVYLAFAESQFSKRGKGPWQFNRWTARRYGLRVDKWVDERRDPVLSTRAAAEYLADLHDQADKDWRVAVVGWNMGEGYLDRYWLLEGSNFTKFEGRLPRRTRQLLNRFMAVDFIAHNAVAYGIGPVSFAEQPSYEMHRFHAGTLLATVARLYRTTTAKIRALNPALRTDRVPPGGSGTYAIRLPMLIGQRADASF
jgi:membrane-bound lytic murein transglycosylase D